MMTKYGNYGSLSLDLPFSYLKVNSLLSKINSLLSKIDQLRGITNHMKPAILGITESKLDSFVTNAEV